jgi:Zn-dependent metalloprotease
MSKLMHYDKRDQGICTESGSKEVIYKNAGIPNHAAYLMMERPDSLLKGYEQYKVKPGSAIENEDVWANKLAELYLKTLLKYGVCMGNACANFQDFARHLVSVAEETTFDNAIIGPIALAWKQVGLCVKFCK